MHIPFSGADVSLVAPPIVFAGLGATALVTGTLVVWAGHPGRTGRVLALVIGLTVGLAGTWWLSDGTDLLEVDLPWSSRFWAGALIGGLAVAVVTVCQHVRRAARVLAVLAIPVTVVSVALGVNSDFGVFRTVGALHTSIRGLDAPRGVPSTTPVQGGPIDAASWRPPEDMPSTGTIRTVTIPATRSGFHARPAVVYLPPAALVADPPVLPVLFALSGRPGAPADLFTLGEMSGRLDAQAKTNRGLAPIVIGVDHLGAAGTNPMCIDSPLGNAAKYIVEDVVAWTSAHFRLTADRSGWGVVGFSTGGTCALQLLAGHPERFSAALVISGEGAPGDNDEDEAIERGFDGDRRAWEAQKPARLFAANTPFPQPTTLVQYWGNADQAFVRSAAQTAAAAEKSGVTVIRRAITGGHDWNVVRAALRAGVPVLSDAFGIGASK